MVDARLRAFGVPSLGRRARHSVASVTAIDWAAAAVELLADGTPSRPSALVAWYGPRRDWAAPSRRRVPSLALAADVLYEERNVGAGLLEPCCREPAPESVWPRRARAGRTRAGCPSEADLRADDSLRPGRRSVAGRARPAVSPNACSRSTSIVTLPRLVATHEGHRE